MRYRRLDLNLLVALDALLEEGSVSRAAQRLNLGQSATSAALGRLREHFRDPLLVPVGRGLELTPLARQLAPRVREVLSLAGEVVETSTAFEPARCERRFILVASDYVAATLLPAVSRELARQAPAASLVLRDLPRPRDGDVVAEALEYRRSDLVIVPQQRINPRYPHEALLLDELCCVVCACDPAHAEQLGLAAYCAAEHVIREFTDGQNLSLDTQHLREIGIERRVAVAVQSFSLMGEFVVGTPRIATLFRRQAEALARRYPLRVLPSPIEFPAASQVLQWHPQQASDPALTWLRQLLAEQAAKLDQG
ncbi:LysR family transcriptional regulator [Pseudomonas sp. ZM23]|uniref:LysR family transcriptional regulator n=1 Tax=Pseudomonas triclosanedens TaxID=2961893 RepID=A0ABY6ZR47_9PSED|nr:LysR family transcriptional regulator [Pseudomonas triclosanedens]MCP8467534.1 LysR family transcriptional regulator [Pseudomonas triclosanedens]MCP8471711.1 LysR family transcriptional regulator [Pseudomonas triclosanedens]MCP8478936.1 LysR family transcriptional regulator [Pseudomonas triclosanedens]WAI47002.1 LysR family transcriptional regulator [Pseudomonas triclosanedens]